MKASEKMLANSNAPGRSVAALPQRFEVMDADVNRIKDYIVQHAKRAVERYS